LNFQRKLVARSTDDNKQLLRGEVTITQVSVSCTEATESIKASCDSNDTVQLKESVTSVQVSVTQLKTIVESFDGSSAVSPSLSSVMCYLLACSSSLVPRLITREFTDRLTRWEI
jgi:hypothetical protein